MRHYDSITWMRCIATLLITNSHFTALYPEKIGFMSFGGFFGNCLFFLISGFCLAHNKEKISQFCLKRMARIYIPYLLFIPVLVLTGEMKKYGVSEYIFPIENYHFIPTIITLYPIYYMACKLNNKTKFHFQYSLLVVLILQLVYYFFFFDFKISIYEPYTFLPMATYFELMLVGGILRNVEVYDHKTRNAFWVIGAVTFIFYVFQTFKPLDGYASIISLFDAAIFICALAWLFLSFETVIKVVPIVKLLAGLTLEIYIVQYIIIDAYKMTPFPVGVLFCMISIVAVAFCLNKLAGGIVQLFKREKLTLKRLK